MKNVYLIEVCKKKVEKIAVRAESEDMAHFFASGYMNGDIDESDDFFDSTIEPLRTETECECISTIDSISDCDDIEEAAIEFEEILDDYR